jgi:D-tyrosyl-tRNA(Tyr) deacylase
MARFGPGPVHGYSRPVIAVVQRVARAVVRVEGQPVGEIGRGLLALTAVERGDAQGQARWMASKLASLRMFRDETGQKPFHLDVRAAGGEILLISNFTVAASCSKGRRPSLDEAAPPEQARPVLEQLLEMLRNEGVTVKTGRFGAMKEVELLNDGPVTFVVQTPR